MTEEQTPAQVLLFECNLDDMTGEALGYVLERVLEAGALDAWYTSIHAKKSRPAVVLSVICRLDDERMMARLILTETSTLGLRRSVFDRILCDRETMAVETRWGTVSCKIKRLEGRVLNAKPEYEDCARISREVGVPLEWVTREAQALAWERVRQD